jgi:hypothetical protein
MHLHGPCGVFIKSRLADLFFFYFFFIFFFFFMWPFLVGLAERVEDGFGQSKEREALITEC